MWICKSWQKDIINFKKNENELIGTKLIEMLKRCDEFRNAL